MSTALTVQSGPVHSPGVLAPLDKAGLKAQLVRLSDPEMLQLQNQLAAAYDAACKALIGPGDVQKEGNREFKKKSAWRKLGRHFGISTVLIRDEIRTLDAGEFIAIAVVRGSAPWGQEIDAIGACGSDEEEGRRKITLADALATAQTRATNRAVSDLIAMGEVSAEELGERKAKGADRPELTLEEALEIPYPWKTPKKYAGKPLREVSTRALLLCSKWAKDKIDADEASNQVHTIYEACKLISETREDLDETIAKMQNAAAEDDKNTAAATTVDGDGALVSSEATTPAAATPPAAAPTPAPAAAAAEPEPAPAPTADENAKIEAASTRLTALLKSDRIAPAIQRRVNERLVASELTLPLLEAAIAELENAEAPF